jgi:hypothetical protein
MEIFENLPLAQIKKKQKFELVSVINQPIYNWHDTSELHWTPKPDSDSAGVGVILVQQFNSLTLI